ncbi:hypothetical protein CVV68_13040 [Arthrobacter livingstonensis]|uniref:Glycoside hydrolase 123-like N-terminal domain-containing protein n=1 Tax=Arthrobacter livingstonensis TaxID=670078 RepID=A0A2V5LIH0_9MICC|nr:glycoside hydrolase domain-containing protein [Arthrobacter livingstonensis]PYI66730.1 hypothetical protein CVV68_13040 [Arthrobacter livingstonensis]
MPTPETATPAARTIAPPARLHPELDCGTGEWDKLVYGNHRIVVMAPGSDGGPAGPRATSVILPWRRQDPDPAAVDVIVVSAATGARVRNVVAGERSAAAGRFTFEPVDGAGTYYFYYLPYAMVGSAHYPQAQYLPARPTADPAWVRDVAGSVWAAESRLSGSAHPEAMAVRYESASAWDSLAPMNFTATGAELSAVHARYAGAPFLLFAQDRRHAISMKDAMPAHWAIAGPAAVAGGNAETLCLSAQPGEDYVIQLGLYAQAELTGVCVDVTAQTGGDVVAARCINTAGIDHRGRPFNKTLVVADGAVQALFVVIPVPAAAAGSSVEAVITVSTSAGTAELPVRLDVAAEAEADIAAGGIGDPRELRRLAWLDSTLAHDDELVRPFIPVTLDEDTRTLGILGRTMALAATGLPAQLCSTFTAAVTGTDGPVRTLLRQPLAVMADLVDGPVQWDHSPLAFTVHGPARIGWTCTWTSPRTPLQVTVEAQLEADGAADCAVRLHVPDGAAAVELEDVRLVMALQADAVPYSMGLGTPGGRRIPNLDWSWDVPTRNQESIWLGDANIGVQLALRDDNYERPLNTNFYRQKPLTAPESWANPGAEVTRAGVTLKEVAGANGGDAVVLEAFSGGRTMAPGESLNYGFRLLLTPFKPINPARQLANRYFHDQGSVAEIAATGATVVNIHHATALAPFINDPLLSSDALAGYVDEAHAAGLKVKVYDTVRELTAHSPDLLPMLSLNGEIFSDGPGRGHIWLQEHAGANYVSAWHAPNVDDIAVVTAGESRLQNWYIRGLDELIRRTGLDGIYLDDIAYDRHAMKRVRKVLQRRCADPEIDIHSANQFNGKDGFASSANMYLEQLPYTDRLWLGEYFDYDNTDPAYWLVEVSGIPFGLMGEMLEGGGNPWRGLVFGMTGRAPRVDNRPLWAFWAAHGLAAAPMVGHWDPAVPVRTNHPGVLATSWITPTGVVVALASWAPEPVAVTLEFADGFESLAVSTIAAPAIDGFQPGNRYSAGSAITVEPGRGTLLVIDGA